MDIQLSEVPAHTWGTLERGRADVKHPFHFPVVGTASPEGHPCTRVVVFRKVVTGQRLLETWTDARSDKVAHLRQHPRMSWLFYDHQKKEQVRMQGGASLHHQDELCRHVWPGVTKRGDYLGRHRPGTAIASPADNTAALSEAEADEQGFANFCIIRTVVDGFTWLKLQKEAHLRAQFRWQNDRWQGQWIAT